MADTFFPFSSGPGASVTDDGWSQMAGLWAPDGIVAEAPRVVLPGGLTFSIPDGFAGTLRGFYYRNAGVQTVTAPNNTSSLNRRDRLVLRLDRTEKTITPTILQGTPGSDTPPLPNITRDNVIWDEPVCHATAPGSGSAQNYSTLVHEFRGVSSARGKHAWQGSGSVDATGTTFTLSPGFSDGIATLVGGNAIKLGRPGVWSLLYKTYSDDDDAGLSTVWWEWPGGPGLGAFETDSRLRGSGFVGAGVLSQRVTFHGVVSPSEADALISLQARWQAPGTAAAYTVEFYAHYLGG